MVDAPSGGVELSAVRDADGHLLARACGEVSLSTAAELRRGLGKLLADGLPVLLDVSGLRLTWRPGPEVFSTAVAAAGGWPVARLVLFGADPDTGERLRASRVSESVPLAETAAEAAALVATRPARLSRGVDLPGEPAAIGRARGFLRETCRLWQLPEQEAAEAVAGELARHAVDCAGTEFRLRLVLDGKGLRVSVRGHAVGEQRDRLRKASGAPGLARALPTVIGSSRAWGVLHYLDGTAVWALLPVAPVPRAPRAETPAHRTSLESSRVGISPPRRQHFETADPEQAHVFLRSVYGGDTLHLASDDTDGFYLRYDGITTNRLAVERLSHVAAEAVFAPGDGLIVVEPLIGEIRVASRRDRQGACPGEVLLIDGAVSNHVTWTDLDAYIVRLDAEAIGAAVTECAGLEAGAARFQLSRSISPARAKAWRATIRHLRDDILGNAELIASPLVRTAILRHLATMLVETFPNPVRDALDHRAHAHAPHAASRAVQRAVQFIDDHADDDIGLRDIAAAAGVGPRALQLAFRRHRNLTPLGYLRRVRLTRAHQDLRAANPTHDTVAAIAARWGFSNHSSFSAAYLRAYGESPSTTLRS